MTTRARDEELLEQVRLRHKGVPPTEIARMYGTYNSFILDATNNVMKADIRESGEPIFEVAKHYWRKK